MKIDAKIKSIIDIIQGGKMDEYLKQIDNSDFGIYVPVYEDQGVIKPIPTGYSQTERNLVISVERNEKPISKTKEIEKKNTGMEVGWYHDSQTTGEASKLPYPYLGSNVTADCKSHCHSHCHSHCKSHCSHGGGPVIHCIGDHTGGSDDRFNPSATVGWPELDYHRVVKQLDKMQDLLKSLNRHGLGLFLLHGHSDEFMFTKLPEGYVAVITNGETTFRKEVDVKKDETFVPNVWRSINGKLRIAGGHSQTNVKKSKRDDIKESKRDDIKKSK